MGKRLDVQSGAVFGFLTVIREVEQERSCGRGVRRFECQCVCGTRKVLWLMSLRNGGTTSCGCKRTLRLKGKPAKNRANIQAGMVFGRLTVISEAEPLIYRGAPIRRINCQCTCGNTTTVRLLQLNNGLVRSCGCLHWEYLRSRPERPELRTHADSRSKLYRTWVNIKQRLFNPNHLAYPNYGGRGISIRPEWITDYVAFKEYVLSTLGPRPDGFSIDRIDNDGPYDHGNLRWADDTMQNRNKRPRKRQHKIPTPQPALI